MNYINKKSHKNEKGFVVTFSAIEMFQFAKVPERLYQDLLSQLIKFSKLMSVPNSNLDFVTTYDENEKDRNYPKMNKAVFTYSPTNFMMDSSNTVFSIRLNTLAYTGEDLRSIANDDNFVLIPRIVIRNEKGANYPLTPFKEIDYHDDVPAGTGIITGFDLYLKPTAYPEESLV